MKEDPPMKLGFVSDSLGGMSFEALLDNAARLGVAGVEVNTGGWSTAPHFDLQSMKASADSRREFAQAFEKRGLEIVALNANGNPLHPTQPEQGECLKDTIRIAGDMGIKTVCAMSGLPAGCEGDLMPNWVVSSWPPETQAILRYQWEEKILPFWTEVAALAKENGVERIALELHGNQFVYNVPSLLKLRAAVGPVIGANLDPSHLFWMGADPLVAADALGEAIHHVHAKDTMLNGPVQATTSLLENGSLMNISARSWSFITLGFGHGEEWWRQFCYRLKMAGYDGWMSVEHEDVVLNSLEGLEKSIALLKGVMPVAESDYKPQPI
jgi:sugar phosphate isomerase/epimerase